MARHKKGHKKLTVMGPHLGRKAHKGHKGGHKRGRGRKKA